MSTRSMTRLDFGEWQLQAYGTGWTIGKPRRRRANGDRLGEEYLTQQKFYATLSQAIRALQERRLRECAATTVAELGAELDRFRAEVEAALGSSRRG